MIESMKNRNMDVTDWIVPPECQGQTVEVAYGTSDDDGTPYRRVTDRSASPPAVTYEVLDWDRLVGEWEPQNCAPEFTDPDDDAAIRAIVDTYTDAPDILALAEVALRGDVSDEMHGALDELGTACLEELDDEGMYRRGQSSGYRIGQADDRVRELAAAES
jgi:hypothetical protein